MTLNEKRNDMMLDHEWTPKTRWEINHDAGTLHITIARAMYVPTEEYIPGITAYRKWTGNASYSNVSCANAGEFETVTTSAHVAITYVKPLTVSWLLPDGTTVMGTEINAIVPSGTTVCFCDDFRYTSINMHDTACVAQDHAGFPPIFGTLKGHNLYGRFGEMPRYSGVLFYAARSFMRASVRIKGTVASPSATRATIDEIQARVSPTWSGYRDIAYAPYVTGGLGDFASWSLQPSYIISTPDMARLYNPTYGKDINGNPTSTTSRWETLETNYFSFHHCGVHGYPSQGDEKPSNSITDFVYYACPNATPEDFDKTIEIIMDHHTMLLNEIFERRIFPWTGYVWTNGNVEYSAYASGRFLRGYSPGNGAPAIPACGTLTISNRTADPAERARRVALLRDAGWTVTEVDDSIETGIYAAND